MFEIKETIKIYYDEDDIKDIERTKETLETLADKIAPYNAEISDSFYGAVAQLNNLIFNYFTNDNTN